MELSVGKTRLEIGFSFAAVMTVMLLLDTSGACSIGLAVCVLHECGHLLCMLILGERPSRICLSFYGMRIETRCCAMSDCGEIITALSGPLINLLTALVFWCASQSNGDSYEKAAAINLCVGAFNLLPCLPLDAGRALNIALTRVSGEIKAKQIMNRITLCLLVPLALAGIVVFVRCNRNFTLIAVSIYIGVLLLANKNQLPKDAF